MQVLNHTKANLFIRRLLTGATMAAVLMFVGTPRAAADDDDCQRRTAYADHKLHEAIEDHGYYSRQAEHWRHELHEARERCWKVRLQWWDEDERRWHHDRDWDDHDHEHHHDHDRDHD